MVAQDHVLVSSLLGVFGVLGGVIALGPAVIVEPGVALTFAGVAGTLVTVYAPTPRDRDLELASSSGDLLAHSEFLLNGLRRGVFLAISSVAALAYLAAVLLSLLEMAVKNAPILPVAINLTVFALLVVATLLLAIGLSLSLVKSLNDVDNSFWKWLAIAGARRLK